MALARIPRGACITASFLAWAISAIVDLAASQARDFPFKPDTYFDFQWWILVGGLLFSTIVSLLFLPTIYMWLDVMRHWPARFFRWLGRVVAPIGHVIAWPIRKLRKACGFSLSASGSTLYATTRSKTVSLAL